MKIKIEIKSVFGKVLFALEKENNTIKETLEQAVKENADLEGADLEGADLRNSNLINSNLRNSNLEGANLRYADLEGANLRYADLRNADLINADLRNADLINSNLRYADLEGANLRNSNLEGADLKCAKNKETAILPIFCKWSYGIKGDLIIIGCKQKTIEEWDIWFNSNDEYSTSRGTEEFKQIEAIYNALKYYYLTLNK